MPSFIATYTCPSGQPRNLTIKAGDLADARKQLRRRGFRATELRPTPSGQKSRADGSGEGKGLFSRDLSTVFEKAPGVKEKAVFAKKLAAIVGAGVPIVRSLDLMATQQKRPIFKRGLTKVSLDVDEGIALGSTILQ